MKLAYSTSENGKNDDEYEWMNDEWWILFVCWVSCFWCFTWALSGLWSVCLMKSFNSNNFLAKLSNIVWHTTDFQVRANLKLHRSYTRVQIAAQNQKWSVFESTEEFPAWQYCLAIFRNYSKDNVILPLQKI